MKMLFSLSLAVLLFSCCSISFGQRISAIDSLEANLDKVAGVDRAIVIYELVYSYLRVDVEKARAYDEKVKQLLTENNDDTSLAYLHMARGIFLSRTGQL